MGSEDDVVREGSSVVWQEGRFIAGVAGISSAEKTDRRITFAVGSGEYRFRLTLVDLLDS